MNASSCVDSLSFRVYRHHVSALWLIHGLTGRLSLVHALAWWAGRTYFGRATAAHLALAFLFFSFCRISSAPQEPAQAPLFRLLQTYEEAPRAKLVLGVITFPMMRHSGG